jgi:hypothetical protein
LIAVALSPIFDFSKEIKNIQNSEMKLTNDYNVQEKFEESLIAHQEIIDRVERKVRILPFVTSL